MTSVRIPPTLRSDVEGRREIVASGRTVGEVLEDVCSSFPSLRARLFEDGELAPFVNVYVGPHDVRTLEGLDTPVDGQALLLLPAMAGGADGDGMPLTRAAVRRRDLRGPEPTVRLPL